MTMRDVCKLKINKNPDNRIKGMYHVVCSSMYWCPYLFHNDNIYMIFTCARYWPADRCVLADNQWAPFRS